MSEEWLLMRLKELEAERDALKARLAECEAGAAAMREVLEDVDALHRSASGQPNQRGDSLTPMQVWERVRAALSSSAGRETTERLRRLEAVKEPLWYIADLAGAICAIFDVHEYPEIEARPVVDKLKRLLTREDVRQFLGWATPRAETLRALEGGGEG